MVLIPIGMITESRRWFYHDVKKVVLEDAHWLDLPIRKCTNTCQRNCTGVVFDKWNTLNELAI